MFKVLIILMVALIGPVAGLRPEITTVEDQRVSTSPSGPEIHQLHVCACRLVDGGVDLTVEVPAGPDPSGGGGDLDGTVFLEDPEAFVGLVVAVTWPPSDLTPGSTRRLHVPHHGDLAGAARLAQTVETRLEAWFSPRIRRWR